MNALRTVTLRDVAQAARVSTATASRVLNGGPRVSEALRQRVEEKAQALGYVPNLSAQAMKGQQDAVTLIADDAATEAMAEMVSAMEDEARLAGVIATVSASNGDPDRQLDSVRVLRALRPRAILLTGRWLTTPGIQDRLAADLGPYIRDEGGRVVIIGRAQPYFPSVGFDDYSGSILVGEHMATLGRSSAVILAGPVKHPAFSIRAEAFQRSLHENGINDVRVVHGALSRDDAMHQLQAAMSERVPELVLACSDVLAIGALRELRRRGLRIPEDVALSGFDDIPLARHLTPPLTTVALPFSDVGRAALNLALAPRDPGVVHSEYSGTLVVRASSRRVV